MTPGTSCANSSTEREAGYGQSGRPTDITREVRYPARTPGGDQLAGYMETSGFGQAPSLFSASRDESGMWFKRRLAGSRSKTDCIRR